MSQTSRTLSNIDWQVKALQQMNQFFLRNVPMGSLTTMGNVQLTDLNLLGYYSRVLLQSMGVWNPADAWKLYAEADSLKRSENLSHLKSLALTQNFGGVGNKDTIKTLAKVIYFAPNRDPSITLQKIEDDIRNATDDSFFEKRRKEMKSYLNALGVGKGKTNVIVIQNPGANLQIADVRKEYQQFFSPTGEEVLIQGQTRTRYQAGDRKQFLKDAIKNVIYKSGVEGVLTGSKLDLDNFDSSDINQYFNNQSAIANKKPTLTDVQKLEVQNVIDEMIQNKELEKDAVYGVRLPTEEQAKYILESEAVRIGKTYNPNILQRFQKNLDEKSISIEKVGKIGSKRPAGYRGLFVTFPDQTGVNMRFGGSLLPKDADDVEDVIDALGIDPKTGFAPNGFAHTDLSVTQTFPMFNVLLYPAMADANKFTKITDVKETKDAWELHVIDTKFDPQARQTMWIQDKNSDLNVDVLKTKENAELIKEFAKDTTYGGSLCPANKYSASSYYDARMRMAKVTRSFYDYVNKYTPDAPKSVDDSAKDRLFMAINVRGYNFLDKPVDRDRMLKDLSSSLASITMQLNYGKVPTEATASKLIYGSATPKCQLYTTADQGNNMHTIIVQKEYEVKKATKTKPAMMQPTNLAKKLDNLKDECKSSPSVMKCIGDRILLSTNITDDYLGSGGATAYPKSPFSLRLAKLTGNDEEFADRQAINQKFSELAFATMTGIPVEVTSTDQYGKVKTRHLHDAERIEILDQIRVKGTPLTINQWKFISFIPNNYSIFE